jgi:hypothetical protein
MRSQPVTLKLRERLRDLHEQAGDPVAGHVTAQVQEEQRDAVALEAVADLEGVQRDTTHPVQLGRYHQAIDGADSGDGNTGRQQGDRPAPRGRLTAMPACSKKRWEGADGQDYRTVSPRPDASGSRSWSAVGGRRCLDPGVRVARELNRLGPCGTPT